MALLIWIAVFALFGAIFVSIIQEARKPPPPAPPPAKDPEPPVFNTYVQVNQTDHHHTHNTMNVTVVKAEPRED